MHIGLLRGALVDHRDVAQSAQVAAFFEHPSVSTGYPATVAPSVWLRLLADESAAGTFPTAKSYLLLKGETN